MKGSYREQVLSILNERARWKQNYQRGLLQKVSTNKEKYGASQIGSAQKMGNLRKAFSLDKTRTQGLLDKVKAGLAAKAAGRSRMRMQKATGVR